MTATQTDALVIGCGPVGLFLVFELGLLGMSAHLVDILHEPGGQCIALYADKPIYDIPGQPCCTGRELTQNLLRQISPFAPHFHLDQQVSAVSRQPDGCWRVSTSIGEHFLTRTLFIAAGVGAFVPKQLRVDGLSRFLGCQLYYHAPPLCAFAGHDVVIVGGEDAAVANAIALAQPGPEQAKSVTLVHRRDVFQACDDDLSHLAALRASGRVQCQAGQVTGISTSTVGDALTGVVLSTPDGQLLTLALDFLLVCSGLSPKLGPVSQWGLAMQRSQICVDTETFATSEAGIFAVGDVVTYRGKKKLMVCGFHEATLAAFAAAALISPEQSTVLQYTTSSALLQHRLGVSS